MAKQDESGDDIYTLDVGPDRCVEFGLAALGEFADTAPIAANATPAPANCWSDVSNPCVSAIFLWQGLGDQAKAALTEGLGGQIGIADWLMSYAAICERKYLNLGDDLPGVFHYEIVESMGAWLAEQENQPCYQALSAELDKRTSLWLEEPQAAIAA